MPSPRFLGRRTLQKKLPTAADSTHVQLLQELVEISSTTLNTNGVMRVQLKVAEFLAQLGFHIEWLRSPDSRFADLLLATRPGLDKRYISFVTHADTVLEQELWGAWKVCSETQRAFGSGVIDNKGGLVVLLKGLQSYISHQIQTPFSLRVICSPNEEMGSVGFTDLFRSFSPDSVMALGFEPALDNGAIISSRRGNLWYKVQIEGLEGHAGRSQGEHLNAAHELAHKIVRLSKLTNYKKGLAVNVGHIQAGRDRYNVICGKAEMKLDARFRDFKSRDWLHKKIETILRKPFVTSLGKKSLATTGFSIEDDCPPFASTRNSRSMIKKLQRLIANIEHRSVLAQMAGGAGDVNYLSRKSGVTIDGLGPIGGHMHTEQEFVELQSLTSRAQALSEFLQIASTYLK